MTEVPSEVPADMRGRTVAVLRHDHGPSRYDLLGVFAEDIATALRSLGVDAVEIDLQALAAAKRLVRLCREREIAFLVGFNGLGLDLYSEGLGRDLGVPLVAWYVDHPVLHARRLSTSADDVIELFIDAHHVTFADRWFPPRTRAFVPHGASAGPRPPAAKRLDRVVFPATLDSLDLIHDRLQTDDPLLDEAIDETCELALDDHATDIGELVLAQLVDKGLIDPAAPQSAFPIVVRVDQFVREVRRRRVVEALGDVPLDVIGAGWEHYQQPGSSMRRQRPLPLQQLLSTLSHYRYCLNVTPNYVAGGHERLLYAMARGCVSLTNANPWTVETIADGTEAVLYAPDGRDLADRVAWLSEGGVDLAAEIGAAAAEAVDRRLSWRHRMADVCNLVALHRGADDPRGKTCMTP
ncbi:MAG: glycosyltransferase family protein [Acidimicrobiales bacterium]